MIPTVADPSRVNLGNWQDPPHNRWAFSNISQIMPVARIAADKSAIRSLPTELAALESVDVTRINGEHTTVRSIIDDTFTDAIVVLHGGTIAFEEYTARTGESTPHLLMSATKSVVGCVVGILVAQGTLDPSDPVTRYVPEFAGTGYDGATIRDLLDMRSGIHFSEEYTNMNAEVRLMEQAMGWRPGRPGSVQMSMYEYLTTLRKSAEHGGVFDYRSCETDALGWVAERAAGQPMAELISEHVWKPIGAEHDAIITVDGIGTAVHDGGMCATARDLARFGQMLLDSGIVDGLQVVPRDWLRQCWSVDLDIRDAFTRSSNGPYLPGGWYRNQFWFLPRRHGDVMLALGIYGQMLYICPGTRMVAAKLSTWPDAQHPLFLHDTLNMFDEIGSQLSGTSDHFSHRPGLPGVAAGVDRRDLDGPSLI